MKNINEEIQQKEYSIKQNEITLNNLYLPFKSIHTTGGTSPFKNPDHKRGFLNNNTNFNQSPHYLKDSSHKIGATGGEHNAVGIIDEKLRERGSI